jgi:RNA polymerase sigma-70 factor (ECF subfamily)
MIAVAMGRTGAMSARAASRTAELDAATLARCTRQDPMAFRAFVARYERAVFALLSRLLGRGPHVEDLAQEAFLRAFRAFPRFDPTHEARPSTWLLTIATRLALDTRRNSAFGPSSAQPLEAALHLASPGDPETERGRRELGEAIARAAAELTDDQRAVFVLAEFHDLSHAEIARAVGVPEATVKTRLFRAREHMRARLRDPEEAPDER